MALVTFTYITYNHNGTGVRHHHFSSSNVLTSLPSHNFPGSTDNNPGNDSAFAPDKWNDLPFAFMSIHAAADGNHLYTSPGNQSFLVGSSNVDVLVVYAPEGTSGPDGGPGIWVDAFNVDTGAFSDDVNFIKVFTPPTPPDNLDSAKTDIANWDGSISTHTAEHIRASDKVDGSAPFLEWKQIILPSSTSNSKDQDIKEGESNQVWFAFYQTPKKPTLNIDGNWKAYDPLWWLHSWWGHGPDPGPDVRVWAQQYLLAANLSKTAQHAATPEVRMMALQTAYKQIESALESLKVEMRGAEYKR